MTRRSSNLFAAGVAALALLAGCTVGPNYQRPVVNVPAAFPAPGGATSPSLGTLSWETVFQDEVLRGFLRTALTNNFDARLAAARVLQARAAAGAAKADWFPSIAAGGDWTTARSSQRGPGAPPASMDPRVEYTGAAVGLASYEVDLWGRIRRANEAARARLLAAESTQETVRQSVIAEVARAYFEWIELEAELEVTELSYANRTNSLRLTEVREQGGVASLQDVRQAQVLVHTATSTRADVLRRRDQKENELRLLLGGSGGEAIRGLPLAAQHLPEEALVGLPSELLTRRPDIRAAEQSLIAANADIGQARAAYYPRVTLTGSYGYLSLGMSDLFTAPARTWQFGPSVSVPLLTGGRLKANERAARARFDEAVTQYQRTVQSAFREVADALVAFQRSREFRLEQEARTVAHRDARRLANLRYEGGVTSYLEVLYNEQELLNAELALAQGRRNELLAVVQLYRALGGGTVASATPSASR